MTKTGHLYKNRQNTNCICLFLYAFSNTLSDRLGAWYAGLLIAVQEIIIADSPSVGMLENIPELAGQTIKN